LWKGIALRERTIALPLFEQTSLPPQSSNLIKADVRFHAKREHHTKESQETLRHLAISLVGENVGREEDL